MLSNRDRQELFALSNKLEHKYILGKEGLSDSVFVMLDKALTSHELIKVQPNKNNEDQLADLAERMCTNLKAYLIKIIGRTIVLYRPRPPRKK